MRGYVAGTEGVLGAHATPHHTQHQPATLHHTTSHHTTPPPHQRSLLLRHPHAMPQDDEPPAHNETGADDKRDKVRVSNAWLHVARVGWCGEVAEVVWRRRGGVRRMAEGACEAVYGR